MPGSPAGPGERREFRPIQAASFALARRWWARFLAGGRRGRGTLLMVIDSWGFGAQFPATCAYIFATGFLHFSGRMALQDAHRRLSTGEN